MHMTKAHSSPTNDQNIVYPPLPPAGEDRPALGVARARPGDEGGFGLRWFPPHLPPCGIPYSQIYAKRSGICPLPRGERRS
ncbi:MAG: hypothetical protein A2Y65_05685 [Deltaproteobacteria bacterium RBG_13_52_11]|nr:MAG: hypothetical protein A2Y65_05685 [Deltaproteobacteria bacterium RBG_13_52_11]